MKIALCFYGQPRYIKECYSYIKKYILDIHNPDIYYHLWWDDSYIGKTFKFHATDKYLDKMDYVFSTHYPNGIGKFEPQINFDISNYQTDVGEQANCLSITDRPLWCKEVIFKQKSAFYSIQESIKQIENPFDYDLIILTRLDVLPQQPFSFPSGLSKSLCFDQYDNLSHLADWFICGTPHQVLTYSKLFNELDDICKNEVLTTTTLINKYFCHRKGMHIRTVPFNVNIFRNYKEPTHMNQYSLDDKSNFPYWMQS